MLVMESNFSNHSSDHQTGRLLVAGDCANWTTLVSPLVENGFQVEMVSTIERAGIRCVEQVIDAVVIDLTQEIAEISNTIQLLRSVSRYTKIVVVCESTQDVPVALAGYENLQRVVSDISPNDFVSIMRTAVRVARLSRERNERTSTLKSLVTKVNDPSQTTADLEKLLRILQKHNPRTPFPKLKLPEIDTLTEVLARSLDPLTASRAAVDFIERCLPGAMIVTWLVNSDNQIGIAACAGNGGSNSNLAARLLSDVENTQLPLVLRDKQALVVDNVLQLVRANEFQPFDGRWAMLAPCCVKGECLACIFIVGPVGTRPSQAEQGLGDVCNALGAQLAFDARIHKRIYLSWPNDVTDDEPDLFG